jgi:cytochrome P450
MDIMADPTIYPNPTEFQPFRFCNTSPSTTTSSSGKNSFAQPDPAYLTFGYGSHACPGRFFAVNELKIAMSYLLMRYEWKFPEGQKKPAVMAQAVINKKDPKARVLYRRRMEEGEGVGKMFW